MTIVSIIGAGFIAAEAAVMLACGTDIGQVAVVTLIEIAILAALAVVVAPEPDAAPLDGWNGDKPPRKGACQ